MAAAVPAAATSADQSARVARAPIDDSQTDKHCPPDTQQRELAGRTARSSGIGDAQATGARANGSPRDFVEDGRPMEDDPMTSLRSSLPEADVLLEAPESEVVVSPVRRTTAKDDPGKPTGPDYGDLRTQIVATMAQSEKSRRKWRESQLALPDDMPEEEKEKVISKQGRLKQASPETQKLYLSRGRGLMVRYRRESNLHISLEDTDPREFVNWLLGLKPFLTINSWRSYRAASLAIIQTIPSVYIDDAVAMLQADLNVGKDEGAPVSRKPTDSDGVGATMRAKRMDHQHLQALKRRLLITTRSPATPWLMDWLDAGINTGLRPSEWALTSIERRQDRRFPNGRVWLHIVSAKAAEGRATHRTLDLSNFSADALDAIERMVTRSREWVLTGQWADRQYDVSRLLRKVCKLMFPRMQKQYTLYSLRHQFIANMKTIYTREEVAAMIGHISLDTQVDHYGKKRIAWESRLITEVPMPLDEQVVQIKKRLELFDLRREDIAQKRAAKGDNLDPALDEDDEEEAGYDPGDDLDAEPAIDTRNLEPEMRVKAADVDPSVA
ncbi:MULTISPECIES: hypothetical protein [unclassified Bradyrhizobium]